MANLDFYAVKGDLQKLLGFIYDETDVVCFESYSEFDRPIRCFKSLQEIESAFEIGTTPKGQICFQLWSASVTKEPEPRKINLKMKGRSFRYAVEGAGLIQLYLGGVKDNVIGETHYGHWNQAGAEAKCVLPTIDCDWEALKKISGKIQRYIRGVAVGKVSGRVILPEAFSEVQNGKQIRFANLVFGAQSNEIVSMKK